ncbi:MAG: glycosyltransferase family 4 protein [Ruminococcus sp.]|nr:glycosyltransferase family 4 protein [Ruminococcus sp.]
MKIAFPVYLHGFGGAERQVINLANQMVERGHEVHMILLSDNKINYKLSEKVELHSLLNVESRSRIKSIYNRRKELIKVLHKLSCDVVVNFNFQSAYFLSVKKNKSIGKIIYSERADPGDKEYGGIMGLVRRYVLHKIDGYVFQSDGAREYFKDNYIRENSIVIPNACFLKKEDLSKEVSGSRTKRIVTVGRLSLQKNQRLLIESFAKIADRYSEYDLEIYGDGDLRKDLELFVKKLKIQSRVKFKGTTSSVLSQIKDASLFVLSSDYEGIPNVLIEAMALGLPCISTDCRPGGARTLITHNKDGLITPVNDVDALAKAMDYILANPNKAEEMAAKASEITERLSPKVIYDKWEYFFNQCIAENYK